MSKIKKLLLSSVVAVTMAIAFVIGVAHVKPGEYKSTQSHLKQVSFNEMFDVKQYTHEIGDVKVKQGGSNLKYEYTPNATSSNSIAYQYIFNNPMNELMAINLKTIDTTGVTVSYAYSDTRLTNITNSSTPFEPQTIASKGTKYFYIIVTPDSTIPTSFQANVVWYQGRAGTLTINNTANNTTTTQVIVKGQTIEEPEEPTMQDGYVFTGWYMDEECTTPAEFPLKSQGETIHIGGALPNLPSDWIAWDENSNSYHMIDPYRHTDMGAILEQLTPGNYTPLPDELVIPEKYDDGVHGEAYITAIPGGFYVGAFYDDNGEEYTKLFGSIFELVATNVTSVTILAPITEIPAGAFAIDTSPDTWTTRNNLKKISLRNCTSLISIGEEAFKYCTKLESVDLSNCTNLTSIEYMAFDRCERLKSVDLTNCNSLTTIGGGAFSFCNSLTSIIVPENVESIGANAFNGCYDLGVVYNLSSLDIKAGDDSYLYIDEELVGYACFIGRYAGVVATSLDNNIETINGVKYYKESSTSYIVLGLEDRSLSSITLHANTTSIRPYAFYSFTAQTINPCTNLTSVYLSNCTKLTTIGNSAFSSCSNLTNIDLSNCTSLTTIGNSAFSSCSKLTSIVIPASVGYIAEYAFSGAGLTSATFMQTEGWYVSTYTNLSSSNISNVGTAATYLKSTYKTHVWTNTEIDNPASNLPRDWIAWDSSTSSYYVTKGSSSLVADVVVPGTFNDGKHGEADVTYIGNSAFTAEATRLKTINLNACTNLTSINEGAFRGCENLVSVKLSQCINLTSIGKEAFSCCYSLKNIDLSTCNNLTSIGYQAFLSCENLTTISFSNTLTTIGLGAFNYCHRLRSVDFSKCSNLQSLSQNVFMACENLTSVDLSACTSLTEIGYYAFMDCYKLTSIVIPESLTKIYGDAFSGCLGLFEVYDLSTSLNITKGSSSNGYLGYYAKDIYTTKEVQSKLITIGDVIYYKESDTSYIALAFNDITATTVTLSANTTRINNGAFSYCDNLTSITIPATVKTIGRRAFYLSGVTSVTFKQTDGWYFTTSSSKAGYSIDVTDVNSIAGDLKTNFDRFWYNTNAGGSYSDYS